MAAGEEKCLELAARHVNPSVHESPEVRSKSLAIGSIRGGPIDNRTVVEEERHHAADTLELCGDARSCCSVQEPFTQPIGLLFQVFVRRLIAKDFESGCAGCGRQGVS